MACKGKLVPVIGYLAAQILAKTRTARPGSTSPSRKYAKPAGYTVVDWFYGAAVRGVDAIETRPGLAAMLARIAGNGVRTIIVEIASRFARDLMVQEVDDPLSPWCRR